MGLMSAITKPLTNHSRSITAPHPPLSSLFTKKPASPPKNPFKIPPPPQNPPKNPPPLPQKKLQKNAKKLATGKTPDIE